MSLSSMLGRFISSKVARGSQLWSAQQKKIRQDSKLYGATSRMMRDAQSAIRKDIRATERDIKRASDASTRYNLSQYLDKLKSLQRDMRQSNKVDGYREYNKAATRLDALNEYLTEYKGKSSRQIYAKRIIVDIPSSNKMFNNMGGQAMIDRMLGDVWSPALEDLVKEYYEQVRAYDYDRAQETLTRIRGMVKRVKDMYSDTPQGTTDYDRY